MKTYPLNKAFMFLEPGPVVLVSTADDGKHTLSVGASDQKEAIETIMDMFSNVRDLRVTPRVGEE
jgi:hypothetical protein